MKQSIKRIINVVMKTAVFALVITGCQKTQIQPAGNISGEPNTMNAVVEYAGNIPGNLEVPKENKLASQVYAKGVQIYQVQRSAADPNVFKWALIAPLATLYADEDFSNPVGNHYVGPTWEFVKGFNKGEKTVAKKMQEASVDATAIPWLLLKTVDSLSSTNNKVTYVQRLYTTGGLAPTTGADEAHVGTYDSIPYTATYIFYTAKH